jgi:hypothetical protein
MRKLIRIGHESYIGNLYKQGKVTLRDAATLLNLNQMETLDLFLDAGISGNLDATDVLTSLRRFGSKVMGNGSSVLGIFFRRRANRFPAVQ